jgi:ABC-type Fe3+/spermidine/putrescine transport system ATPase subunit
LVYIPALNAEINGIVSGRVSVGETVAVSIRPEKIRLAEKAVLNQNCFVGRIDLVTYIGSDTHLHVSVNDLKLKVWEQNKISSLDPAAYYTVGQKIWITLFPENTLVLANE